MSGTYDSFQPDLHGHFPVRAYHPHLVVRGRGFVETPYARTEVGPGDMFCLWEGVRFEYGCLPDAPWGIHWLQLAGPGAAAWVRACGFSRERPWLRPADPVRAGFLLREVHGLMRRWGWAGAMRTVASLYELAVACAADPPARPGVQLDLVQRATEVLAASPGTNVAQLADSLGVSRTTLFLAFRRSLKTTPVEFITSTRLSKARSLLKTTGLKVSAVGAVCGFAGQKYFMRRFREVVGCTPSQYRSKTVA